MLLLKHSFDFLLNLKTGKWRWGWSTTGRKSAVRSLSVALVTARSCHTGHDSHFSFFIQKLTSIKIQNDKMRTGNLPANMKKNRVLQIIPCKCPPRSRLPAPAPITSTLQLLRHDSCQSQEAQHCLLILSVLSAFRKYKSTKAKGTWLSLPH